MNQSEPGLKRTPLYSAHQALGGKLIEFGGWEMPVQYTSITDEHLAVRKAAGIFDISHMGEIVVTGAGAEQLLNVTLTNDVRRLKDWEGQYTLMCNEQGGVIDDLYLYRLGAESYLLIVNASRIAIDFSWLEGRWRLFHDRASVQVKDQSSEYGAVAVQGPRVIEFIDVCFAGKSNRGKSRLSDLKKNELAQVDWEGASLIVARTGYTGEDGFEIVAPAGKIEEVWKRVSECGRAVGIKPCGLGARDTLRTEVCYPLYGHELDESTTPIEAGLGFFVALEKGDFVGRDVLAGQKATGPKKRCVAFKMTERSAPPRPHYVVYSPSGERIGEVVSGTQSPSLGNGIGLAYVTPEFARPQEKMEVEIRGRRYAAEIVKKPIYARP